MSKIEKVKLENGLTIYLYEDKRKKSTFVDLVTKFGGIHHDFVFDGKKYHIPSGVAHFLEHFLLEHTPYGNLMRLFGKRHLYANGMTSISKTEFYFSGVVHIEDALITLIDAIHRVSFTKEEMDSINVDMVNMCYKVFYRPSNECMIIAGNFDKEKMIEKIKECYQKLSFEKGKLSLERY